MASLRLLAVLLAAAILPLSAHEVFYSATIKNGTKAVGTASLVTWHNKTVGWLNYTISLDVKNLTVSMVSINDEEPGGEVVFNLTSTADSSTTGMVIGTYEDTTEEIGHFSHQPGAHALVIVTNAGTLLGETYQILQGGPGVITSSLMAEDNKTMVGNATITFKANTNSSLNSSLAIVLFPPTALKGTLTGVVVEEDGATAYDWTSVVNMTLFNMYGEASGKTLLDTAGAEHLAKGGHYLVIKTTNGSARGELTMPLAAAPAPAPSSTPLSVSPSTMGILSYLAAMVTLLLFAL